MEICSVLCRDTWSKIIEFCDTHEWVQLSYTCKGINQFKFNRLLMFNKERTLKQMRKQEFEHWLRLGKGTFFNVYFKKNPALVDEHFQFLEGIHTLSISEREEITDNAFSHLTGIHTLDMSYCDPITDNAFRHLAGIHTLDISGCRRITDEAFKYLTGIHTLDMSYCTLITDNAFPHLVGIQELTMNGCDQKSITEKAFVYLKGIHTLSWSSPRQDKALRKKVVEFFESSSTILML